jgi:hypothetical protein
MVWEYMLPAMGEWMLMLCRCLRCSIVLLWSWCFSEIFGVVHLIISDHATPDLISDHVAFDPAPVSLISGIPFSSLHPSLYLLTLSCTYHYTPSTWTSIKHQMGQSSYSRRIWVTMRRRYRCAGRTKSHNHSICHLSASPAD